MTELTAYGYVRQIVWIEAGIDASCPGVSCFTSPDAESIWESISYNVRRIGWQGKTRSAPNKNMSWGSRDLPSGLKDNRTTHMVYGKTVAMYELEPCGFATATDEHVSTDPTVSSFKVGDAFEVLQCREFLPEFWLTYDGPQKYKKVPAAYIDVHLNNMDSEDFDADMFTPRGAVQPAEHPYEMPVVGAPQRTDSSGYEVPGASQQEESYGFANEYAEPRRAASEPEYVMPVSAKSEFENDTHDYMMPGVPLVPRHATKPVEHDYMNQDTIDLAVSNSRVRSQTAPPDDSKHDYMNQSVVDKIAEKNQRRELKAKKKQASACKPSGRPSGSGADAHDYQNQTVVDAQAKAIKEMAKRKGTRM